MSQIYKDLKATVPSPVLKSCLDDMVHDSSIPINPFDDDSDDGGAKPSTKKKASESDTFAGSLLFKSGRNASSSVYFTNYSRLKNNGNGLEPEKRNELLANLAQAEKEHKALFTTIISVNKDTAQLLSEPTNEDLNTKLAQEEALVESLREKVSESRKLMVNEQHKNKTKRRIVSMCSQWRKRKRLCMDFLIAMEENTDGMVTVKKCLSGDGQIDVESDERAIADSKTYAKNKKARNKSSRFKTVRKGGPKHNTSGMVADESFIGVHLDVQGKVVREYLEDEEK
eukprot:CAMPEP_0116844716 /NCGR_PEP_ID=MMETSP0418-20121206/12854_1 /TAXON_ID=1158023 /ORGANISM="Astrosyne radiata, Strain 13vi08-1A" /LENGTH=283 /DNA_ID=CAMNT_0004475723 /DNA_START=129 /DNA_END=980 /DNA_ORIENTATION=+